jgi:type I restriction enzyme M protein
MAQITAREAAERFVLFSEMDQQALESRSTQRVVRGKPVAYAACLIRAKDVQLTPEERTRQLWLARLMEVFRYPQGRIQVEYPITFGRDTSKRADIVVFDADRPTVPYIIIEVKQPKLKDGKEQLRSYAHATGAPLAMWSNGTLAEVWHRKNPNYFMPIHDLPRADQTIEQVVDQRAPARANQRSRFEI